GHDRGGGIVGPLRAAHRVCPATLTAGDRFRAARCRAPSTTEAPMGAVRLTVRLRRGLAATAPRPYAGPTRRCARTAHLPTTPSPLLASPTPRGPRRKLACRARDRARPSAAECRSEFRE